MPITAAKLALVMISPNDLPQKAAQPACAWLQEYYLQLLAVKRDDTQPIANTVSSSQPRRMSGFSTMLRKSVDGSDALYPALPLKRAARSLPAASVVSQHDLCHSSLASATFHYG